MPGASERDIATLEKKIFMSGIKRADWWPDELGHELTFAFHVRTGERRWFSGDKVGGDAWKEGYREHPLWITGTTDYYDGVNWIDDLKTGSWPQEAEDNRQLLTYALPFWLERGRSYRDDVVLTITQWPKYPLAGLPMRRTWLTDGVRLEEHLQDLIYALENPGEVNPTENGCRFCESQLHCKEYQDVKNVSPR